MSAKTCPKCGQTQPSATSPICECGYDFTIPSSTASSGPPSPSGPTHRYHTFWRRIWAGLIDGLVLLPINIGDSAFLSPHHSTFVIILWGCLSCTSTSLYTILMHARYGQTVGKMATRVKVLELTEQHIPSLGQAILRDIGDVILNALSLIWLIFTVTGSRFTSQADLVSGPAIVLGFGGLCWFLLEFITMLTNSKRRALHDFIAGTVVVRCRSASAPPAASTSGCLQRVSGKTHGFVL